MRNRIFPVSFFLRIKDLREGEKVFKGWPLLYGPADFHSRMLRFPRGVREPPRLAPAGSRLPR
ncbi:hypothetical protein BIV59_13795 [Bacillus sp. MUM 13]|nr:hypothetical protein BIV59_13795 [Bacillus sp. MUM 13]